MSVSVEIEVENESEGKCPSCGAEMGKPAEPEMTKDEMLAELKKLLNDNTANGRAERQMKIDELMSKLTEMGSD